jgi:trimethylamine--corrinoid protein Co-methyltransferase
MSSFEQRFRIRAPTNILKRDDKQKIHESALDVMEHIGIKIHSSVARHELKRAGAVVDSKSGVVKFPKEVVDSLIKSVPHKMTLAGREKEFDLPVDGTHHYYTTDGCGIAVWDEKTKTRRPSVLEDIRKTAVIADWLPYLSIYEPMVVAHDVPAHVHVILGMKEAIENTTKHILSESTTNADEAKAQVKMAAEIVGSAEGLRKRHYISAMVCTISPLTLDGPATDAAMIWAHNHVPVHITGMGQMGLTGPATLAGDLVQNHAETLALACAMQAHERGAPLLYGSVLSNMDPRTGAVNFGSPETIILAASTAEMGRFMDWPVSCGGVGPGAVVPGPQASIENAIAATMCAMVGSEIMNGIGLLDDSTVLSYEELLIDNDLVGLVINSAKEIEVNKETLAIEIIEKVGIGGTYLTEMHTLKHARGFYAPTIWSKDSFSAWVARGKKSTLEVAKEKAEWVLKEHKPKKLDQDKAKALNKIVNEFKR